MYFICLYYHMFISFLPFLRVLSLHLHLLFLIFLSFSFFSPSYFPVLSCYLYGQTISMV
jgi:hypothetical protein